MVLSISKYAHKSTSSCTVVLKVSILAHAIMIIILLLLHAQYGVLKLLRVLILSTCTTIQVEVDLCAKSSTDRLYAY